MFATLLAGACVALVAPAAEPSLRLERLAFTQGLLGPERASADFYPQDAICLRYVVTGLRTDDSGQFDVTIGYRVLNAAGTPVGGNSVSSRVSPTLGGNSLAGPIVLPLDDPSLPAGEWTVEVTATDNLAKQSTTRARPFRTRPPELAVVRAEFSTDDQFRVPARPTTVVAGQPLFFRGKVVGFTRDEGSRGNAAVDITVSFLDADGHVVGKPYELHQEKNATEPANPLEHFFFTLQFAPNRPGKFTMRVVAHDKIGKKTATLNVPLHVQE